MTALDQQNKKSSPTLFLIDGSSYLYRAYFAIRQPMTTHDGFPTKVIYGLTNMLWKVLREKDPEYVAMVWDAKGTTFRHELYTNYKTNRPAMPDEMSIQIPYVKEVVNAMGLKQLEEKGYEADDIIATLARGLGNQNIIIVSGDKDLLQLIGPQVSIWDSMKDEVIDLDNFYKRFGLEPVQFLDVMTLTGDTSDNIPGVPGIGLKTALKLIKNYGSVDNLIRHLDELPNGKIKERIELHKDRLDLWRKLVSLADDIAICLDINSFRRNPPDRQRLRKLFKKFNLTRFLDQMVPEQTISFKEYELIQSQADLIRWAEMAREASRVVIDTETTSEFPMKAEIVGISLCITPPRAAYVPIGHKTQEPQLNLSQVAKVLGPIFSDQKIEKIGQNIKYDLIVLANHGMELKGISEDTMLASYLLNPSKRRHNLAGIAQEVLGHHMISFKEVTEKQKRVKNFAYVPLSLARDYSCEDVHVTSLVQDALRKRLKESSLWELLERVEVPLIRIIAEMEMSGILVDIKGLDDLSKEFSQRLYDLDKKIIRLAGEPFNINSTKQLAEILFVKLKLPQIKKTRKRTGYSTDVDVLKELAQSHELPQQILIYRNLSKLKYTYVDGLKRMLNPDTGRVHTSFNQTVTSTGRLSSSDPNLQNIPVRTEEGRRIRALFIPAPGNLLLSADYSQIELRVLAHYSGDEALINAFRNNEDIHRITAAEVFSVFPELVTPEMRRAAKTVNFGIIYGISAYGLAKELGIGNKQAKEFIDRYFAKYPGVKRYIRETIEKSKEQKYVTTLLGRRRHIPDIKNRVRAVREFAERTAINTPIQGTAADIIKLAMIKVDSNIQAEKMPCRLLLQVHDELIIEASEKEIKRISIMVKETMENVVDLAVPLKIDICWGVNWAKLESK
ncbi:MAG: DNA polymerase I [delta proteobacterium ML8_D]|jgi:DNA polymerase I|nr:MAG: DNA polymerase I [delta proteobacterium ML8_D]